MHPTKTQKSAPKYKSIRIGFSSDIAVVCITFTCTCTSVDTFKQIFCHWLRLIFLSFSWENIERNANYLVEIVLHFVHIFSTLKAFSPNFMRFEWKPLLHSPILHVLMRFESKYFQMKSKAIILFGSLDKQTLNFELWTNLSIFQRKFLNHIRLDFCPSKLTWPNNLCEPKFKILSSKALFYPLMLQHNFVNELYSTAFKLRIYPSYKDSQLEKSTFLTAVFLESAIIFVEQHAHRFERFQREKIYSAGNSSLESRIFFR